MNDQLNQLNYQRGFYPPPPPVFDGAKNIGEIHSEPIVEIRCNMCSSDSDLTFRSVTKDYVPRIAYVLLVLSLLIGLIVIMATRVRHKFEMPFCGQCWRRSRKAGHFEAFALLSFFGSLIIGLVLMLSFDNGLLFSAIGFLGLGVLIWSQIHKRKNTPKYKSVDRKQVIVSTATGELIFVK